MSNFIALDFESTGLLKNETEDPHLQPGIVQWGAVKYEVFTGKQKPKKVDELNLVTDPECFFEEKSQEITGMTKADIEGKPNLREAFSEIASFFLGTLNMVTFNGFSFDAPLLQYNLKRYGLETRFPWPPMHYDLMQIGTDVLNLQGKQGNKYPSLMELHQALFDKAFENHHMALSDAQATADCALKLCQQGYIVL